jgi:subtilase family serine protease
MREFRMGLAAAAVAMLGLCVAARTAGAQPMVVSPLTSRVALNTSVPPTTAQCQNGFGISCYSPAQLQAAYDLQPLYARGQTGAGRTIAIVDSFGSPTITQDLAKFDADFGLPAPPSLKIIQPAGQIPPFDPANADMVSWAEETSLDVEYAHAIAPGANILLVETPVAETEGEAGFSEILRAENYVIDHRMADVITQSFGATEDTFKSVNSLLSLRSAFTNAALHGVTVLGSSGDNGSTDYKLDQKTLYDHQVNSWPSSDPLVTSVGGTQLHLDAGGNRLAPDNVWNDSAVGLNGAGGGGPSHVFARPPFQLATQTGSPAARSTPDISMSAAVDGGALVYITAPGSAPGYHVIGGTSEASPLFSGIVAIAAQIAGHPLGDLNPRLYALGAQGDSAGIVDITRGDNTFTLLNDGKPVMTVPGYAAGPGYDMASGLGTIDAPRFTNALANG